MDISVNKKDNLEKQGYRIVGNHSAIKVCHWVKKSLTPEKPCDVCYKKTFYGIQTWRCIQMSPSLQYCNQRCEWCWRDIQHTAPKWTGKIDEPKDIVNGCIDAQIKYLQGFGGNPCTDLKRYEKAQQPLHFALSLTGEPTLYPKLPELIQEIHSRDMTSFVVTNGTNPEMLSKLIKNQPTQLYMTLTAPNKETYEKVCHPIEKGNWEKMLQSLNLLKEFDRSVIRLTLAKDINMICPEDYAKLLKENPADFIELKAYMWIGHSRNILKIENMPTHQEIINFAKELIKHYPELKIIDEKIESRVLLLMKKDFPERIMKFEE